jgi:hypothetical protein
MFATMFRFSAVALAIDDNERYVLTLVGVFAMAGGALGGLLLATQLDGGRSVDSGFWTALLAVAAVSALPLVATTTQIARLWAPASSVSFTSLAPLLMLGATAVSLVVVILCLYEVAVASGTGDPNDIVVYLTTVPVGATVGAAVVGVAAAILDKIDDRTKPPAP